MSDRLTALDATFLELEEADESAHMHIGAIMVFDPGPGGRVPSLDALAHQLDERLDALPRYRRKLSASRTGGLRWPEWVDDPDFDLRGHLRRAALPAPGGERELLEWAGDYWSQRLDRTRPLWEIVLIEGLEGGRWALASKTHHAMVDGVGSVDVSHLILDAEPAPGPRQPISPRFGPRAEHHDGLLGSLASGVRHGLGSAIDAAVHPRKLADVLEESKDMLELLLRDEVVPAPGSSINLPIGAHRRFEVLTIGLDELKAIKKELGGTVNDVVLAGVTGGLRRLLVERGDDLPDSGLRAMVPVNVRAAGEHLSLGNKVSSLFVHLPVAEPDPLRRYRVTAGDAEDLKSGGQARGSSALISLTAKAPPVLHSTLARGLFASRLFNVTVTNVPGPQQPLYAFGSRMEQVLPLVPLAAEHAVGIAVVSYAGKLFFGLNADDRAVPDLATLRDGIFGSFVELENLVAAGAGARDAVL